MKKRLLLIICVGCCLFQLSIADTAPTKITGIKMPELISRYLPGYSIETQKCDGVYLGFNYFIKKEGTVVRLTGKAFDSATVAYERMENLTMIPSVRNEQPVSFGDKAICLTWKSSARLLFQKNNIYFDINAEDSTAVFEVGRAIEKSLNEKSIDSTVFTYNQTEVILKTKSYRPEDIKDGYITLEFGNTEPGMEYWMEIYRNRSKSIYKLKGGSNDKCRYFVGNQTEDITLQLRILNEYNHQTEIKCVLQRTIE